MAKLLIGRDTATAPMRRSRRKPRRRRSVCGSANSKRRGTGARRTPMAQRRRASRSASSAGSWSHRAAIHVSHGASADRSARATKPSGICRTARGAESWIGTATAWRAKRSADLVKPRSPLLQVALERCASSLFTRASRSWSLSLINRFACISPLDTAQAATPPT